MEDLVGQTLLERYRVDEFIGRGGMAEVYRAYDMRRRITVALKFLREDLAEDEVFLRRFRREAKVLETLQHPSIVRYFGFEESEDWHFLVVEFIDGEGLRKKLSRLDAPLTLEQALHILEPVCNALHYAHAEGIFHCDVKPANIMIAQDGRVVVADFGISKLAESATLTYGSTGTPAYMAPEQCRGQKVDARTDIYALGITAFEMLTLDRPFIGEIAPIDGAISERIRWEHLKSPPPSPRDYNPDIPEWASKAILKALQKRRNRRFSSVLAFYDAISRKGEVAPDANLPWSVDVPRRVAVPATAEPTTPKIASAGRPWEQRLNDLSWGLRRTTSRASGLLNRMRQVVPSVASASSQAHQRLRRAMATAARRIPVRPVLLTLVGLVATAAILAIWLSLRGASPPTKATATRTVAAASPALSPAPNGATAFVQARAANVRTGPSTLYPVRGIVYEGQSFEVLARSPSENWYNICCLENGDGWIHSDLVRVAGDVTRLPVITLTPPAPQQIGATSTPTHPPMVTATPATDAPPTSVATRPAATLTLSPARTPIAIRPTATVHRTSARPVASITVAPR